MGQDVPDMDAVVILGNWTDECINLAFCFTGIADGPWKAKQMSGRAGRDGRKAVSLTFVFPQPGKFIIYKK